jgi:hypothetical protein
VRLVSMSYLKTLHCHGRRYSKRHSLPPSRRQDGAIVLSSTNFCNSFCPRPGIQKRLGDEASVSHRMLISYENFTKFFTELCAERAPILSSRLRSTPLITKVLRV